MNNEASNGNIGSTRCSHRRLAVLLWIIPILILGVGISAFEWRWEHANYKLTSLRRGGGINPLWRTRTGNLLYLAPTVEGGDCIPGVYALSHTGGKPTLVAEDRSGFSLTPMSCDTATGQILALENESQKRPVLYLLDPATKRTTLIKKEVYGVGISRQGRMAVVIQLADGGMNIALYDLKTKSLQQLTNYTSADYQVNSRLPVEWTPDCNFIVFGCERPKFCGPFRSTESVLMEIDVKTGEIRRLSTHGWVDGFSVNPVDGRIAYGNDKELLFVLDKNPPARRVATNYTKGGWRSIDWSPDGKMLAYDGRDGNLWLARVGAAKD